MRLPQDRARAFERSDHLAHGGLAAQAKNTSLFPVHVATPSRWSERSPDAVACCS
jgi:hypothetical protein